MLKNLKKLDLTLTFIQTYPPRFPPYKLDHTATQINTSLMMIMKKTTIYALTFTLLLIFSCSDRASADHDDHEHDDHEDFLECLYKHSLNTSISSDVYTPNNASYSSILQYSIWNLRFRSASAAKPQVIITPEHESQIPAVVLCARDNDMAIRTRSGGHDHEGLSYLSEVPFVIIDLINMSEINVDAEAKTAWVGAGATTGSLYYRIGEKSRTLGFPAGLELTLGLGGHISGGGYGSLLRKYGMAADNVLDARIVDANGRILDRKSMGEDMFWAIRGGGGASFGVILAWKLQLVDVPETVTVFRVRRTLEQNAIQIIHRWQYVAPTIDKDLYIGIITEPVNSSGNFTMRASIFSLFLGGADRLLPLMQESFPELGLVREDCIEMSWVRSTLFMDGSPTSSLEVLLNRTQTTPIYMKAKTDYVQKPIPVSVIEGLWQHYNEPEAEYSSFYFVPYGGRMDEISESTIPFPHRNGTLYMLANFGIWPENEATNADRYISWVRRVYDYLTPYVSKSPRATYLNYRDIDLGVNNVEGETSYAQASRWGVRYYKGNFDRLVRVKTIVDPRNFFRYQQSIPPLHTRWTNDGDD